MWFIPWKHIVFLLIPIAISVFLVNFYSEIQNGVPGDANLVKFLLYTSNVSSSEEFYLSEEKEVTTGFIKNRNLTLWIHGFGDSPDLSGYGGTLLEGYLNFSVETNLIALDWTKLSEGYESPTDYELFLAYFRAVKWNVPAVAKRVASFLALLVKMGLASPARIHLIGFSTGAHVAAQAAHIFQTEEGIKLARLTGLDPVGPGFDFPWIGEHVMGKDDAEFVDVIHTNIFFQGVIFPKGHFDVYVNNAISQPGCPSITSGLLDWSNCPHGFSIKLYAKTVTEVMWARKLSWCNFVPFVVCQNGTDQEGVRSPVGYFSTPGIRGTFHIWTEDV